MKKITANVNLNDRIVCDFVDHETCTTLQYWYEESRTGNRYKLGKAFDFSMSVKNYFGGLGKTFREVYAFDEWHNKRLITELKRINRAMEAWSREQHVVRTVRCVYDDERAA